MAEASEDQLRLLVVVRDLVLVPGLRRWLQVGDAVAQLDQGVLRRALGKRLEIVVEGTLGAVAHALAQGLHAGTDELAELLPQLLG